MKLYDNVWTPTEEDSNFQIREWCGQKREDWRPLGNVHRNINRIVLSVEELKEVWDKGSSRGMEEFAAASEIRIKMFQISKPI